MTAGTWELSPLGFDLLWTRCGLDGFPVVLQLASHGRTRAERDQLFVAERSALHASGAVRGSTVHPQLEAALRTVARPVETVDLCGRSGRRRWRVLAAADRERGVVVVREEQRVVLSTVAADHLAAQVVATLPDVLPGAPAQLNAPSERLTSVLAAVRHPCDAVPGLRELGCVSRDAQVLAEAFTSVVGTATVGVARGHGTERQRHRRVVTVLDTGRGRYLSTESATRDGRAYTTVRAATAAEVLLAVDELRGSRAPGGNPMVRSV